MRETIYLIASKYKVERMTKKLGQLYKGEIPIKVVVEIDPAAYREPTIEKAIHVQDWREGLDTGDVELKESVITETEAEMIRAARREALVESLRSQGYTITAPEGGK